jgi:ribonucleoside-diphosphate reductase alpha chain
MPANDGTGNLKEFECEQTWRLLINGNSLYKLNNLGLVCHRLEWEVTKPNRESSKFIKITSVEDLGRVSDTYCFTEHKRNLGMFNGMLLGNCTELLLPTDENYTFNCTLGSLNVALYDEWKDTDLIKTATVYLDCVNTEYLLTAKDVEGFSKINRFAERFRPIGLGVMGLHTYMQNNSMVWGGYDSMMFNTKIFKQLNEQSLAASQYLAHALGEPEGCKGLGIRMGSRIAVAPTKSSSNVMGGVSQGIEPYFSGAFVEPLSTGYVIRENPALVTILKAKGKYSKELMNSIAVDYNGSVQHLDFLSDHEKAVFRAVFEINQMDVLKMAASRQKHIDQMQSINLTFGPHATPEEISAVHKEAFTNPYILSLYYMRRVLEDKNGTFHTPDIKSCEACE